MKKYLSIIGMCLLVVAGAISCKSAPKVEDVLSANKWSYETICFSFAKEGYTFESTKKDQHHEYGDSVKTKVVFCSTYKGTWKVTDEAKGAVEVTLDPQVEIKVCCPGDLSEEGVEACVAEMKEAFAAQISAKPVRNYTVNVKDKTVSTEIKGQAQTLSPAECCNKDGKCCKEGEKCCGKEGKCCKEGEKCCGKDGKCCKDGEKCCGKDGECKCEGKAECGNKDCTCDSTKTE